MSNKLSEELFALAQVPELLDWASHLELHGEQADVLEERVEELEYRLRTMDRMPYDIFPYSIL